MAPGYASEPPYFDAHLAGFLYRHPDVDVVVKSGRSAADIVNSWSERELSDIIFTYGEERHARRIPGLGRGRGEEELHAEAISIEIDGSGHIVHALGDLADFPQSEVTHPFSPGRGARWSAAHIFSIAK